MLAKLKTELIKNISNLPGWSIKKKIIIFLVDDWGTIRIPDISARRNLLEAGIDCDSNRFDRFDTLASAEDLSSLFDILIKYRDVNGNPATFTAMTVVANPDFDKIQHSSYLEYYFESFTKTLETYYNDSVFKVWHQGISEGIFMPQFHGREHLNVNLWIRGLKDGDRNLIAAFNQKAIGVPMSSYKKNLIDYTAAFDFESKNEMTSLGQICHEGLSLFNEIFGFQASLFTSSSLIHPTNLEPYLAEKGIKFIDRARMSHVPIGAGIYKRKYYWLGRQNHSDQLYITRNCLFEPNLDPYKDSVNDTLHQIDLAFRWGKPAIISSHRVNFVGQVDPGNRDLGISALRNLLKAIVKKWPDIEFISGSDLGELMLQAYKK